MYEMATGKLPFDGDSPVSVALKQIQEEPVEPILVNPNISPALNQIILKAMQKSTATRYQSATELLQDISQALLKPNALIERPESFVEAGATQVIPVLSNVDTANKVPNLRTRQARAANVSTSKDRSSKEENQGDDEEEKELTPEQKKKRKKKIIRK